MQNHVIQVQTLEVSAPTDLAAQRAMSAVEDVHERAVVPMLEELFSSLVAEDEVVRLDRLVVDVGWIAPESIASHLADRLEDELRTLLPPLLDQARTTGRPTVESVEPSSGPLGTIADFLDRGVMPWYASAPSRADPERLFRELTESRPEDVGRLVRRSGAAAVERLVAQFSRETYRSTVELLVSDGADDITDAIDGWIGLVTTASPDAAAAREIRTRALLWLRSADRASVASLLDHLLVSTASPAADDLDRWLSAGDPSLPPAVLAWLGARSRADGTPAVESGRPPTAPDAAVTTEPDRPGSGAPAPGGGAAPRSITDSFVAERSPRDAGGDVSGDHPAAVRDADSPARPEQPRSVRPEGSSEVLPSAPPDAATAQDEQPAPTADDGRADRPAAPTDIARPTDVADTGIVDPAEEQRLGAAPGGASIDGDRIPAARLGAGDAIYVGNAGLVLLWPFLVSFFGNSGLLEHRRFRDRAAQERGVLLLQYAVTGSTDCPEQDLPLNKLLCGWPLDETLAAELDPTDIERAEVDELLVSVIERWGALGSTSADGLRSTFLQREGRLSLEAMGWTLLVPRSAFDVLLDRLPWGVGVIALPWIDEVVMVEW